MDAVLIIGEHGNYATKKDRFCTRATSSSNSASSSKGRPRSAGLQRQETSPTASEKAKAMVDAFAAAALPDAGRIVDPGDLAASGHRPAAWRKIEEALMVGVGGSDPMDFHALEGLQCHGSGGAAVRPA